MPTRRYHIKHRRSLGFLGTLAVLMLLMTGQFTACEPEDWRFDVNCDDCYGYRPDSANLIVYLTINTENDSVPLTFYEGESGDKIDWQDTATTNEFYLFARIGVKYTVKAEYKTGVKTIAAFDSDHMKLSDYGNDCGAPCYIVKGGIFDLKLLE